MSEGDTSEWDPELVVDEPLARSLIADQFPQLDVRSMTLLGEGWDNTVWLLNSDTVFRFPRRAIAIPGAQREIDILAKLAPHLPLAIPVPVFIGQPTDAFAWPFFGSRLVRGVELADANLTDAARAALAVPLARFLGALHAPTVLEQFGERLPIDPNRRADMAYRVPMTRSRLGELERARLWRNSGDLRWLDAAESLSRTAPTAVVHGDLHARHLLVDGRGALSGVIDWGDIGRGDPAVDLPGYWSVLPPSARPAFLAAYGRIDKSTLVRARVLAVFLSATLALYAHAEGLSALKRESIAGIERALT